MKKATVTLGVSSIPTATEGAAAWRVHAPADVVSCPQLSPALVAELLEEGRASCPEVELEPMTFARYLATRVAEQQEAEQVLAKLHTRDLYLACGCIGGESRAIAEFDRRFLPVIKGALAHLGVSSEMADDVAQALREKLLVSEPGRAPKIVEYMGRGPLASWVRVAAIRMALNLLAKEGGRQVSLDDEPWVALDRAFDDPEMRYIKERYRAQVRQAFELAFAALPRQARTVLRLNFVDGLNIEEIGTIYRVHRSTVARWIAQARADLLSETRRRVTEQLHLDPAECESLMDLVQSQLEVSLHASSDRLD